MKLNCLEEGTSSDNDDGAKEIQKFLTKHLKLTPRRQMFEQYETSASERNEPAEDGTATNYATDNSKNVPEWNVVNIAVEFRQKNAELCMSSQNHQRFKRAKEKEQEILRRDGNHRFALDKRLFPKSAESPHQLLMNIPSVTEPQRVPQSPMKNPKFAAENSLALSHQKLKF